MEKFFSYSESLQAEVFNARIGEALGFFRSSLGITQKELAEKMNVSRHTILNYEYGMNKKKISLRILSKFLSALDVKLSTFLNHVQTLNNTK